MKKRNLKIIAIALILAFVMPFAFMACGNNDGDSGSAPEANTPEPAGDAAEEVATPEPTPEPTTPEPTPEPTTPEPTEPPTDPAGDRPEVNDQGIIPGYRYYLWSPNSSLYLQVERESRWTGFTQERFTGAPNQMFVFEPVDGAPEAAEGQTQLQYYKIYAVGTSNRYLDTEDGAGDTNGALLLATDEPMGENSHLFTLRTQRNTGPAEHVSDPCISVMSVISNNRRCIDVDGVSTDEGHHIHMWEGGTSNNQKWVFQLVADVEAGNSEAVFPE